MSGALDHGRRVARSRHVSRIRAAPVIDALAAWGGALQQGASPAGAAR